MHIEYHDVPVKKILITIIEALFLINIVVLDIVVVQNYATQSTLFVAATKTGPITKTSVIPIPTTQITPSAVPTIYVLPTEGEHIMQPAVKEFFIPFGTGQTSSTDWQDIEGTQSYIDSTDYPRSKQTIFEASVVIPTGNETAWIRLFNKTDGHPVWFSEMSWQGGATQFLQSQPITLDSGNKLYIVQMKTQLQYPANLNQARLHITLF